MSKFTVHIHNRTKNGDSFVNEIKKIEHETYEAAERFALASEGALVKIYGELGEILLSIAHSTSGVISDYV